MSVDFSPFFQLFFFFKFSFDAASLIIDAFLFIFLLVKRSFNPVMRTTAAKVKPSSSQPPSIESHSQNSHTRSTSFIFLPISIYLQTKHAETILTQGETERELNKQSNYMLKCTKRTSPPSSPPPLHFLFECEKNDKKTPVPPPPPPPPTACPPSPPPSGKGCRASRSKA